MSLALPSGRCWWLEGWPVLRPGHRSRRPKRRGLVLAYLGRRSATQKDRVAARSSRHYPRDGRLTEGDYPRCRNGYRRKAPLMRHVLTPTSGDDAMVWAIV